MKLVRKKDYGIDNLLDDFFHGFTLEPFRFEGTSEKKAFIPKLNVAETDKELEVTAELPGLEEKDVDLSISQDLLTITGEKKEEIKDEKKNYYRYECNYGSFQRSVPIPSDVDTDKAEATFKKGVLKVVIPKTGELKGTKKINIKSSE